jgi:Mg2+/citrate symporter
MSILNLGNVINAWIMSGKLHYEFINSQTGNVIASLSLQTILGKKERTRKLEEKKTELATTHKLKLIYWQDKDHRIQ